MLTDHHMSIRNTPDQEEVRLAIKIVDGVLKAYSPKIYLFGSRADHTHRPHSDIDIAVSSKRPIPDAKLSEARACLEQSNLIHTVDLLDLAKIDMKFKEKILEKGILWND